LILFQSNFDILFNIIILKK